MAFMNAKRPIHLDMLFDSLSREPVSLLGMQKYTRADLIHAFFPDLPCALADVSQKGSKACAVVEEMAQDSRTFCAVCCRIDEVFKNYLNFFFTAQREKSTFCRSLFLSLFDGGSDPLAFMAEKCARMLRHAGLLELSAGDVRMRALLSTLEGAMESLCSQLPNLSLPVQVMRRELHESLPMGLAKVIASHAVYLDASSFKNDRKRLEMEKQLQELLWMIWKIQPEDIVWQANIASGIRAFHEGDYPRAQAMFGEAQQRLQEEDRRSNYATASYADLLSYQAHMLMDGSGGERSFSKAYQLIQNACRICAPGGGDLSAPRRFYESAFFQLFHPDEWVNNGGGNPKTGFLPMLQRAAEEGCMDAIVLLADLYLTGAHGCGELKDPARGVQMLQEGALQKNAAQQERARCELRLAEYYLQSPAAHQADLYYEKAARLGSYHAIVHLREKHFSPELSLDAAIPLEADGQICILNSQPDVADFNGVLRSSLGGEWLQRSGDVCRILREEPELLSHGRLLFAFLSDDEQQNLLGALETLKLLSSVASRQTEAARLALMGRVDLFVLSRSDAGRMMIDAAMSQLTGGMYFRTHLCDPDLMAANELLLRHPTFLPCIDVQGRVKEESWKHRRKNERCQRRIVLLGTSRCTQMLVKQIAGTTYLEDYPTQLAVVGPDAKRMEAELQEACPGLFAGDAAPHIAPQFWPCPLDALPLNHAGEGEMARLHALLHSANYFVVAGEDDMENLSLAVRVRTGLIKAHLPQGLQPLIAVRYRDSRTQWLASQIAVGARGAAERYHWTENYGLQLFGSASAFGCEALLNNPLEKRALAIHKSYYRLGGDATQEHAALSDYYRRSYNRDSSLCLALGISYHCFAMGVYHAQGEDYAAESADAVLGAQYDGMIRDEALVEKAARIEHARWNGWCLSRGWTKPEDDVLVAYMQLQNPRHHLEIGKLHPYITGYDQMVQEWHKLNSLLAVHQHSQRELPDPRISDRELTQRIPAFLGYVSAEDQER